MKPVDLMGVFAYPCAWYAIQRAGLQVSPQDLMEKDATPFNQVASLKVGDILIHQTDSYPFKSTGGMEIGKRGVVSRKVIHGRHFAVYEGNGYVSDVTHSDDKYYPHNPLTKELR